jgi:hypothetical protein
LATSKYGREIGEKSRLQEKKDSVKNHGEGSTGKDLCTQRKPYFLLNHVAQ